MVLRFRQRLVVTLMGCVVNLKMATYAAIVSGALGIGILGVSAGGVASAAPSPVTPGLQLAQQPYALDADAFWYGPGPINPAMGATVWSWPVIPGGLNAPPIDVFLPTLPTVPTVTMPTLPTMPTVPTVTMPTMPTVPTVTMPTLPTMPTMPTMPTVTMPTLPTLPTITLPTF
ncbi:hypothetical protein [Mycobacterium sp. 1164985.4]|uniref:hypothetical protein n=1 Tax=Mycobacterium sp. 1164985.4 TaxID=1834069 RepID=UPI000A9DE394|nr:hypothetical protein [Mycobacterium sp. 1164985.4]